MVKYLSTGTPLTDYERELLIILMEECAEVTQAASKLLRFGRGNRPPDRDVSNTTILAHEVGDLQEVIEMVGAAGLISAVDVAAGRKKKRERLAFFMQASP